MSTLNQDNRREKVAYVSILATEGTSKIEVLHGNIMEIRVYISTNPIITAMQFYRQSLLQLFIHLIDGYRVPRLESSSDVSRDIVQLFINICTQVDNGKPIQSIIDGAGRPIINNTTRVTIFANENRLVAETDERLPVQRTASQETDLRYEAETLRRQRQLRDDEINRQQAEQQQSQRRQQQETVRRGINELFSLLRTDGGNDEQVGQVLTEVGQIMSGNARVNPVPTERRRQNSGLFNPIFPVVDALPFPLNLLAIRPPAPNQSAQANHPNQPEDSPFLEPLVRNTSDPQPPVAVAPPAPSALPTQLAPTTTNTSTQPSTMPSTMPSTQNIQPIRPIRQQDESDESEIPSRFVENHSGARREIFPDEKNIITPEVTPVANQPTEPVTHPTHMVPVRNPVSSELIQKIASNVSELIKSGKTRPPDFKLKTKSGMTRIKNYIHNVARVWLSQSEIELFVTELTKLHSST